MNNEMTAAGASKTSTYSFTHETIVSLEISPDQKASQIHEGTSSQRLALFGGRDMPIQGSETFLEWAGGSEARILVLTWASKDEKDSLNGVKKRLGKASVAPKEIIWGPTFSGMFEDKGVETFLRLLGESTGVFLSGGDQRRIMQVCANKKVYEALFGAYLRGIPVAGKSAGTAAITNPMITGDGAATMLYQSSLVLGEGLGFLKGLVIDQHFVRRKRMARLFTALLLSPFDWGLGVDEDGCVLVEDNRYLKVVGGFSSILIRQLNRKDFQTYILENGDSFDLFKGERCN